MNLAIVDSSRQLIDVRQVSDALDKVIDEPRRVLGPVCDVFLLQLVFSKLLLFPSIGPGHDRSILIGLIIWVAWLRLVIKGEEKLNIPGEDGSLCST